MPLSPYNYSLHFRLVVAAFITTLSFPTSHFHILNIDTNFNSIVPTMANHSTELKILQFPFISIYNKSLF